MKRLLLILTCAVGAFAQTTGAPWADVSGNIGASNLSNPLVAKPNFQIVAGAPTALSCVAGKDLAYNSVAGTWHVCTVTGTPGTWSQLAVNPPTGTIVGTTDTQALTNKTVDGVTPTTFGFLDPTSSVQTQINTKLSQAYQTIDSAGTPVTQRSAVNFISGANATVVCVDNAGQGRTDCTMSATAGSSAPVFPANAQTATYQLLAADFSSFKTIAVASGTFTVTGVASGSQPASGQGVWIINYGSGTVTFARSGQNINGGTTSITIPAGTQQAPAALFVVSDGTNYIAQPFGTSSGGATTNQNIRQMAFHFEGSGNAITGTPVTSCTMEPVGGTITGWYVEGDQAGTATFGLRSVAFASYTGTAGFSGYTDVTGGGTAPAITSAAENSSTTLTSWVTSWTANNVLCVQLATSSTFQWVNLHLTVAAN